MSRTVSAVLLVTFLVAGGCRDSLTVEARLTLAITAHALPPEPLLGDTVVLEAQVGGARGGGAVLAGNVSWITSRGIPLGRGARLTYALADTGTYEIVGRLVDGTTTLADARVPLIVKPNTAPTVVIEVLPQERLYDSDTVFAVARASDAETNALVTWHADGVGLIGTGDTLRWVPGNGAAGVRVVTARAIDPQGNRDDALALVHTLSTAKWIWSHIYAPGTSGDGGSVVALADDGRIYAGFIGGPDATCRICIFAITSDGAIRWTYTLRSLLWDHSSGLTVDPDGNVFAVDGSGTGSRFTPDGMLVWTNQLLGPDFHGRLALAPDGALFAAGSGRTSGAGTLLRIDPGTGDILWEVRSPGGYRSGPAIAPNGLLTTQLGLRTLVVSQAGVVVRQDILNAKAARWMSAVDRNGVTYYPGQNRLSAVTLDGVMLWDLPLGTHQVGEPVIDSAGVVYAVSGSRASAIHADGTIRWFTELTGNSWIPRLAVLADGTLLVAIDRRLFRLSRQNGEVLETIEFLEPIQSGLAVDSNGVILLVTNDNRLIALQGTAGLEPGAPWPTWRRDNRRTASVPTP